MRLQELPNMGPARPVKSVLHGRNLSTPCSCKFFKNLQVAIGLFALLLLLTANALATEPGEQVVVIYNSRVPESKVVADFYAVRRQVPPEQVLGFNLTTNDNMSRAEFRDSLQ